MVHSTGGELFSSTATSVTWTAEVWIEAFVDPGWIQVSDPDNRALERMLAFLPPGGKCLDIVILLNIKEHRAVWRLTRSQVLHHCTTLGKGLWPNRGKKSHGRWHPHKHTPHDPPSQTSGQHCGPTPPTKLSDNFSLIKGIKSFSHMLGSTKINSTTSRHCFFWTPVMSNKSLYSCLSKLLHNAMRHMC